MNIPNLFEVDIDLFCTHALLYSIPSNSALIFCYLCRRRKSSRTKILKSYTYSNVSESTSAFYECSRTFNVWENVLATSFVMLLSYSQKEPGV